MYIINYKNRDFNDYCFGVAISGFTQNVEESYNLNKDEVIDEENIFKYYNLIPEKTFEGEIDNEENVRDYIRYYYISVLSKLDPSKIYKELKLDRLVTLDNSEFSHGYIVAAWFELYLGVQVKCLNREELFVGENNDVKPKWVVDMLEEEIKKTIENMKGFNSIRALYLFEQCEELERRAIELENSISDNIKLSNDDVHKYSEAYEYRQMASFRRCDAYVVEDEWKMARQKLMEVSKKRQREK